MRALISVSDKTGIVEFCQKLVELKVEIVSTGGTGKLLEDAGIKYIPIEAITKSPESFGGRMKTISFQIGSALLFRRGNKQDEEEAKNLNIEAIDLVVCNLYPFLAAQKQGASEADLIEKIDIGGPTMIRAAAKNFQSVACVTDPADYAIVLHELLQNKVVSLQTKKRLSLKAFQLTSSYDLSIQLELSKRFENKVEIQFSQEEKPLRYGENPHQGAKVALLPLSWSKNTLASSKILQGKEISYNNYLDSDQAFKTASELSHVLPHLKSVVIIKHGTPCGIASAKTLSSAMEKSWNCDTVSAFGSVISFTHTVDKETACFLTDKFIEVLIAPSFTPEALELLATKKNVRLVEVPLKAKTEQELMVRSIHGGLLIQQEDEKTALDIKLEWRTKNIPPHLSADLLNFGQTAIKYLKSNCLALVKAEGEALVIQASGVGQPNRLECLTKLIAPKIQGQNLEHSILVSDAFFPFADSIEAAHDLGIKIIMQPGGSIKDQEVINCADKFGIGMCFTQTRHFRH